MKRLLLLLLPLSSLAQIPEKQPNTYVNDYTNTLSSAEIRELNDSIQALENRTSVEIAIVLVRHTDGIEDYARELGRKWGVGNAGNGIVYVAALDDHKQRLETGSGVEGNIPDVEALAITNDIKPYFRSNNFFDGLMEMLKGVKERIDPATTEQMELLKEQRERDRQRQNEIVETVFTYVAFSGLGFFLIWYFFLRPYWRRKREEREAKEAEEEKQRAARYETYSNRLYKERTASVVPKETEKKKPQEDSYTPPIIGSPSIDSYSSRSSSDDSSISSNNDFSFGGNDSFGGGGATNDW